MLVRVVTDFGSLYERLIWAKVKVLLDYRGSEGTSNFLDLRSNSKDVKNCTLFYFLLKHYTQEGERVINVASRSLNVLKIS